MIVNLPSLLCEHRLDDRYFGSLGIPVPCVYLLDFPDLCTKLSHGLSVDGTLFIYKFVYFKKLRLSCCNIALNNSYNFSVMCLMFIEKIFLRRISFYPCLPLG